MRAAASSIKATSREVAKTDGKDSAERPPESSGRKEAKSAVATFSVAVSVVLIFGSVRVDIATLRGE